MHSLRPSDPPPPGSWPTDSPGTMLIPFFPCEQGSAWTSFDIDLMTGSNLAMKKLKRVASKL